MTQLAQKQNELIDLLSDQIIQIKQALKSNEEIIDQQMGVLIDLTMISKIELGDEVIAEINRLKNEITQLQKEQA